jgi:excisionase family DNA binding protein
MKKIAMDKPLPEVLTIGETAEYLRLPVSSLYKLAQAGKIPCQKVGRHWRFRRQALERWLEAYSVTGGPTKTEYPKPVGE